MAGIGPTLLYVTLFLFIAVYPLPLSPDRVDFSRLPFSIKLAPDETIAALSNETVSVTCTAISYHPHDDIRNTVHTMIVYERKQNDQHNINFNCSVQWLNNSAVRFNCSGAVVTGNEKNISIGCRSQLTDIHSNEIHLLVQGTIENITSLAVKKVDKNLLNISWTPVFAYDGLNLFYEIHLNDRVLRLSGTSFNHSSKLDPCEAYLNISITPFINTTGNKNLTGKTIYWDGILTNAPPIDTPLNYIIIMEKSGSVRMNLSINSCDCPAISSNKLTLTNDTYSFSVTVPVVSNDSTCSSTASVALSLYMNFEVDIVLHNLIGSTKQNKTILIDTNPLVSFTFINGAPGVLTVLCNFTNDTIIINEYATGCMVFYTDMNEPVQSIPRNSNESTVTMNITNISSTGYYDFYVMVLPAPVCFAYSYISMKPNPSTSTAHHSSSCHCSNSTSVIPTPTHTHTTSFSPSSSISSSPSCTCTPCTGSSCHCSNSTSVTPTPTHTTSFSPSSSISSSPSCTCTPCTGDILSCLVFGLLISGGIVIIFGIIIVIFIIMYCKQRKIVVSYDLSTTTGGAVNEQQNTHNLQSPAPTTDKQRRTVAKKDPKTEEYEMSNSPSRTHSDHSDSRQRRKPV